MRILSIASEVFPLIKTGGLADVAGALPFALAAHGCDVTTLVPGYPVVMKALQRVSDSIETIDLDTILDIPIRILATTLNGLRLFVLDAPELFDRLGGPYSDAGGHDFGDNWLRFAVLSKTGAAIAQGAIESYRPDIVHVHDWQAALAPVYLAASNRPRPRTVLTIHNLAFQGNYPSTIFPRLGLPDSTWSIEGVEYYGNVGFLKGGLHACDVVTTVSPTYADEIVTEGGGMGLDGLLRGRGERLIGIVNGIDTDVWNPETDTAIAANYTRRSLKARLHNKRAIEGEFGLRRENGPIFAVVSRLTWQKGLDLVAGICDDLVERGVRLVVVGTGEAMIEGAFFAAHSRHPDRIGVRIGYDETLSHRVQAGADAILIPSRFEPCGLTQLYGLRYGCIPIVAKVGGLADTVVDANYAAVTSEAATGLIFAEPSETDLLRAVDRTLRLYQDANVWRKLQSSAMKADVSWSKSAGLYAGLYRDLMKE
ncbi:glycogen synthase GlgA [Jiella marina]|uniref:glycogen synthase GlgA n=1 Tax=Jiella sp. LLJ827 TaxID=2917712 RepID=UPI00210127AC|nr:glycogen synthase GlgA [Jiella sp. LLJ827]MCQ0990201.1 glycogen synthase GlgA [Jiella sp. LLJ827]